MNVNEPVSPVIVKSALEGVNTHEIKPSEYEDLPELTDDMIERGIIKRGGRAVEPDGR